MNFSWGFLKTVYAIVAIVLGAINFHAAISWGFGMHLATTIIVGISSIMAIVFSIALFSLKGWYIPLGIVCLVLSGLPLYFCIKWFFDGQFHGSDIMFGGIIIIIQSITNLFDRTSKKAN